MVDFLIIRNNFDAATSYTNWIGDGIAAYLQGKGHTVTDLSDADASPQQVTYWLNNSDKRTTKAVIALDHGSTSAFYGELNNAIEAVITMQNTGDLTKNLHVYTLACSTNAPSGVGAESITKGCFSWLGYTEPVYAMRSDSFKKCIWSYVETMADGKTIEECEQALRQAYQARTSESFVYGYNLERLLLRKKQENMTINTHNREKTVDECIDYRKKALKYLEAYKQNKQWRYLLYYFRYMAFYLRCQYLKTNRRIQLCYFLQYIAAYYLIMYAYTKNRAYLCRFYYYMALFNMCMYKTTNNNAYQTAYKKYYEKYRRCR
jgi:hypothetical protein